MARSIETIPPLGAIVPGWSAPAVPIGQRMRGHHVELSPLDPKLHAGPLHQAFHDHDQVWDYLPYGPFTSAEATGEWISSAVNLPDHLFYAIRSRAVDAWLGVASYLRISPQNGSIEVGHINFSPVLQGSTAATEAMYLMMKWAFDAGYRRYEWKCDALNQPSRRAAQRLGFSYEGIFRQATVVKGRNRDTAWFAITDKEWPALQHAFECWLAPENFRDGRQLQPLGAFTAPIRVSSDPIL